MRRIRLSLGLGLATLLLPSTAALAQFVLPVNPQRLDGSFEFEDKDQGSNNTLEITVEGNTNGIVGQVQANSGLDVVIITYRTDFPNKFDATAQHVGLRQDRQVLISLELVPGIGSLTPAYFGQAAPVPCKVQAKMQDNAAGDPDSPDKSKATLSCDLGSDFGDLDDDAVEGTPGDPPDEVLDVVEAAFDARKDVKVQASKGKLQIKHNGEPD